MTKVRTVHCPRCCQNVDSVLCPRCCVLTEPGMLRRRRRPRQSEGSEPPTYTVHLKSIREGGVDVEAS